jgi:uncharacterized protein with PIN domain
MTGSYTAAQRRTLTRAVADGEAVVCPVCETPVAIRAVERPDEVSYVRHRVWLLCPSCKRTAAVDAAGRAGPTSD